MVACLTWDQEVGGSNPPAETSKDSPAIRGKNDENGGCSIMPTFDISIEFEVYCAKCGAGLCNQSYTGDKRGILALKVEPCERCLESEYIKGQEEK